MKKLLTLVTALTLVFAVAGCKEDTPTGPTDAELVAEATTALLLTDLNGVTSDLTLPVSGLHDSVVTWSSGDTAVISDAGVVTRPAVGTADAIVTITATITIGDESDTKEFTVKVLVDVPSVAVTIAEINVPSVDADGNKLSTGIAEGTAIEVTGVVFGIIPGNGVQIFDETGFVTVYLAYSSFSDVTYLLGDEITITGAKDDYFGLAQVTDATNVVIESQGNTLPVYTVTSIIDLYDEDPYDTTYNAKPITVTGIADVRDIDGGTNLVFTAVDANNDAYTLVVYYKSDAAKLAEVKLLDGKMVTADVIVYGFKDLIPSWRATITSSATFSSVELTDADKAAYEASQINLGNTAEVMDDVALNTIGGTAGSTIAWASDKPAVVTTGGIVTRVVGTDTTVVLTATVTVGDATATKDFTLTVLDADYAVATITVTEALASDAAVTPDGTLTPDPIVVKGIVTAIIGNDKVILQDAAGGPGIVVYASGFNTTNAHVLGDEIILRGTHEVYYGLQELSDVTFISIASSGNTVQLSTTITVGEIVANFTATPYTLQGLNVVLTNLEVVNIDLEVGGGHYILVKDSSGDEVMFAAADIPYSDTFIVGDTISELTVIVWDIYYSTNERVVVTAYPGVTDAEAVAFVAENLTMPTTAEVDIVLPLLDDDYPGVAISWSSDKPLVISNTGVVVQPAAGTADETVVLTATFTLNDATTTETYSILVPQVVEGFVATLFISEYIEGTSENRAIEIYNPTDAAIDLSQYVILENHGDYVNTTPLSGTLAAGDVYVVCNSGVDTGTALDSACDIKLEYPLGANMNGNDTLQLVKNGTVIDQFFPESQAGASTFFADDIIYVRNADVMTGNTVWDLTEWTTYSLDDYSHIGAHTYTPAP